MSGIERTESRVNATHEFFTPTELLIRINDWLDQYDVNIFSIDKTFIDHSCGDGQILTEVLIRKLEKVKNESGLISESDFEKALNSIYGVDIMIDNIDRCRERLLCNQHHLRHIVEKNIVYTNLKKGGALKYGYRFNRMGPARMKDEEAARKKQRDKQKEELQRKEQEKLFKKQWDNPNFGVKPVIVKKSNIVETIQSN